MSTTHTEARPTLPLGLLDFLNFSDAPVEAKRYAGVEAALEADRLGFSRFWIPEHHASGVPSTNPLVLLPLLGSLTHRIRLGPAVTLIRVRDPHLVAEDLVTASWFCRDRLDVGLGRGDVSGGAADALPRRGEAELDAASRLVFRLLDGAADWLDPAVGAYQPWLNGAGTRSAELAADGGFNYCHGLFFNPDREQCRATLGAHADARPDRLRAVAVGLVCNPDAATAARDAERPGVRLNRVGDADACAELILELLADPLVDEVIINEHSASPRDHLAAVRAIAERVRAGLTAPAASTAGV